MGTLNAEMGLMNHTGAEALAPELREALARVVVREGAVRAAARALAVPLSTVRRATIGRPMRRGSHALLRAALGLATNDKSAEGAAQEITT